MQRRSSIRVRALATGVPVALAGLAVSQIGDWLYNLALVTLVYQRTGSALWAGVATAARVVPMVVLGPLGGVIADRFDRRHVMVASDLVRLVLMVALALVRRGALPVVLVPVLAALATAAGTPYLPCVAPSPRGWCATPTCPARTPPGRPSPPSASSRPGPRRRAAAARARPPWPSRSTR